MVACRTLQIGLSLPLPQSKSLFAKQKLEPNIKSGFDTKITKARVKANKVESASNPDAVTKQQCTLESEGEATRDIGLPLPNGLCANTEVTRFVCLDLKPLSPLYMAIGIQIVKLRHRLKNLYQNQNTHSDMNQQFHTNPTKNTQQCAKTTFASLEPRFFGKQNFGKHRTNKRRN